MNMLKKASLLVALALAFGALDFGAAPRAAPRLRPASPSATGPRLAVRTATASRRKPACVEKWALNGENFLWRVPYGGRSAPIVMGNRVYLQNPSGRGAALQERVMALDADTGKVVWEYKFNIFQSDVPPHRVGWASPAADPETGNIYALGVGATVIALSKDGKLLWERSVGEEFAAFTTHGGRTMSPIIDGNLVIVSAAISSWGTQANARAPLHRARQAHRRHRLGRQSRRASLRHGLRGADHRDDQRPAPAHHAASATAPSTRSSRRPARRSGASSLPSARSTPASSSRDRR